MRGSTELQRPDKAFATLQARAALLGIVLRQLEDDRGLPLFVATRWAAKTFSDLAAIGQWLAQIEARRGA